MDTGEDKRVALIEAIYGAVVTPASWAGVLQKLTVHFDGASAALGVLGSTNQHELVHCDGIIGDPDMQARYRTYYGQFDPWPRERARRPVGEVAITSQIYDLEHTRDSPFVNEYFIPAGLVDSIGTALLRDDQNFALLGIQRSARRGTFSRAEAEAFSRFVPHLTTALRVHRNLGGLKRSDGLTELLLDRLATGVIAVGQGGTVVYANAAGERMLARRDGIALDEGVLTTRDHRARDRLAWLLAEVLAPEPGPGGIVRVRRAGGASGYAMLVAPLRRELGTETLPWPFSGAIVLIRDEELALQTLPDQLRALYGLSIEQARLLQALLDGATLLEHAERAGVRPTTARFHLRHVLHKTGTASQSQLMRKVVGELAGLPLLR